jgi:hypothetical protein
MSWTGAQTAVRGSARTDPVAVDAGDPQLGAGVRAFLAGGDPHALRPGRQFEHAGELGDPVADSPVTVTGRGPRLGRHCGDRLLNVAGDGEPDRLGQPPPRFGEPGKEIMGAAAGVGAHQHPPPQVPGQLRERELHRLDVIGRRI